MKIAAILALICIGTSAMTSSTNIVTDADDFIEAFYLAAFGIDLNVRACEGDAVNALQVISESIHMITDDPVHDHLTEAVTHLIENKQFFFDTYADCKTCGPQLIDGGKQLMPLTEEGVAMSAITKATLHHPIAFPNNLRKAKNAFAKGDYEAAGRYSGKDVAYILAEVPAKTEEAPAMVNEIEQFMDHFWLAAFDINLRLEGCTKDTASSIKVIQKAIGLIKDRSNPVEVALSILYIKNHYTDFFSAFSACTHAAPDLYRGFRAFKPLLSVSTSTQAAKDATKHHPVGFPLNLKKGQSAVSDGRWDDAGDYFGKDIHYMLDELPNEEAEFLALFD